MHHMALTCIDPKEVLPIENDQRVAGHLEHIVVTLDFWLQPCLPHHPQQHVVRGIRGEGNLTEGL